MLHKLFCMLYFRKKQNKHNYDIKTKMYIFVALFIIKRLFEVL